MRYNGSTSGAAARWEGGGTCLQEGFDEHITSLFDTKASVHYRPAARLPALNDSARLLTSTIFFIATELVYYSGVQIH